MFGHIKHPAGTIKKYKSRLNADESRQQQGIDYSMSYAPVCHWASICLCFILSVILSLKSIQIDFVQAFPQAPIEDEVYIELPDGCKVNNPYPYKPKKLVPDINKDKTRNKTRQVQSTNFLKLLKNLYNTKVAAKTGLNA